MRLYKMELFKLFQNKIFKIGMLAATGLLFLYFWFAEVGGEIRDSRWEVLFRL